MEKEKFERMTAYEEMAFAIEQAELLLQLVFEELDQVPATLDEATAWKASICCARAPIHVALVTHVSDDLRDIREQLNSMIDYT